MSTEFDPSERVIREWRSARAERMEMINVITTTVLFAMVGLGIGISAGLMLFQ